MSHAAARRLAARLALGILGLVCNASAATAQTTVPSTRPRTRVWDATVRGGTYANTNLSTILETRSSTDPEYLRRALLKFDTRTPFLPAPRHVGHAHGHGQGGSGDPSRRIGVYQVTTSWDETEVTYKVRKTSTSVGDRWRRSRAPAHRAGRRRTRPGTSVSFDVTPLVQQAVAGVARFVAVYAVRARRPRRLDE